MQSTGLLDQYLQATASATSTHHPATKDDMQTNSSACATSFCHQGTINDAQQALNTILASANEPNNCGEQRQTWLGALADVSKKTVTVGHDHQQSASPVHGSSLSVSRTPRRRLKGIFRSMRQADAAVMLEQQLQKDQEQQQQPIFAAPADHANGVVRIIAGNAALQDKLQRLQADMNAKSYRQDLPQQLQTPASLFPPTMHPHQKLYGCQRHSKSSNRTQDVFQGLAPSCGVPRPATSPAALGYAQTPHPAEDCRSPSGSAVVGGVQHGISSWSAKLADADPRIAAVAAHQAGRQQARVAPQLQHLRELADYEPPWPAQGVADTAAAHHCDGRDSRYRHAVHKNKEKIQQRPWTSNGTAVTRHTGLDRSNMRWVAETQVKEEVQGSRQPDTPSRVNSQQHLQQRQQQIDRPASAVAALEQSLSELALLRCRFTQQQQQDVHQQHQHQQAHLRLTSHAQAYQQQHHVISVSQQEQQMISGGTWLSGPRLSCTAATPGDAALAVGLSTSHPWPNQCTSSKSHQQGLRVLGQQSQGSALHHSHHAQRSCSPSLGYSRWSAWQRQIHRHAVAVVDAADHGKSLRYQSAPRPVRVWDALPLQRMSAAEAETRNHKLRCSSSGRLTGHLQQQPRQQQQQRPKTTGGIETSSQRQQGLHIGVRPSGLHLKPVGSLPRVSALLARPSGSAEGCASSAWLLSSPLQRTKQHVAAGCVRSKSTTINRGAALSGALAGSRVSAGAAALTNVRRTESMSAAAALGLTMTSRQAPGRAAAATAQLLQSLRVNEDLAHTTRTAGHTGWPRKQSAATAAVCCTKSSLPANNLSAVPGRSSSSSGATGCHTWLGGGAVSGAQASLTQQLLDYVDLQHRKPSYVRRSSRPLDGSSSDSSADSPIHRKGQVDSVHRAYAAALSRVNAAKEASWVENGSDASSD